MGIKLIHTSDWHLGKRLFNRERIDEQQDFLDWLLDTIKNENIDLLLLAGDIFDVPSPPHAALSLFNTFIERFIKETKSQMVFITGNHDSGSLLESLKPLWNKERIHLKGNLSLDFNEHYFDYTKDDESVRVSLLPFFRNYEIEKWSRQHEETDLTQLLKKFFNQAIVDRPRANHFHILLAHHLFCEFESSVSEQSISLSGLDSIPKELLKDCYDYLALGHIHKYQKISSAPLGIYTGSPIAFRFSETSVKKVNLLEITNNKLNLIALEIPCERKLIKLKLTNYNYVDEIKKLLE
ncbi:MAG: exonuclease SbcD, partial [Thermoproteota archaeon]